MFLRKNKQMYNKDEIFKDKDERNDFIISLIAIAVFIGFVLILFKKNTSENSTLKEAVLITNIEVDTKTEDSTKLNTTVNALHNETVDVFTIKKTKNNEDITSNYIKANEIKIDSNSANTKTESEVETTKNYNTSNYNLELKKNTLAHENDAIESNKIAIETNSIEAEKEKLTNSNTNVSSQDKQTESNVLNDKNQTAKDLKTNTKTVILKDKLSTYNCVIIVGAFKDETNLKKTLAKLEKNGFSAAQGPLNKKGLKYAGVPVDCNQNLADKRAKMNTLNSIFNIDSWLYKK